MNSTSMTERQHWHTLFIPYFRAERPASSLRIIPGRLVREVRSGRAPLSRPRDNSAPVAAYACGMVTGMATRKVTVTLDEAQLEQIRALVHAGTAPSVSGFVQHAVAVALDDVAGWGAMLAEALRQTGGALTDDERAWADDVLGTGQTAGGRSAA
jgi:Arc/MetJ-type ribon-helix-helix transcriptional regulator